MAPVCEKAKIGANVGFIVLLGEMSLGGNVFLYWLGASVVGSNDVVPSWTSIGSLDFQLQCHLVINTLLWFHISLEIVSF